MTTASEREIDVFARAMTDLFGGGALKATFEQIRLAKEIGSADVEMWCDVASLLLGHDLMAATGGVIDEPVVA
jgi:hypothetical protein